MLSTNPSSRKLSKRLGNDRGGEFKKERKKGTKRKQHKQRPDRWSNYIGCARANLAYPCVCPAEHVRRHGGLTLWPTYSTMAPGSVRHPRPVSQFQSAFGIGILGQTILRLMKRNSTVHLKGLTGHIHTCNACRQVRTRWPPPPPPPDN